MVHLADLALPVSTRQFPIPTYLPDGLAAEPLLHGHVLGGREAELGRQEDPLGQVPVQSGSLRGVREQYPVSAPDHQTGAERSLVQRLPHSERVILHCATVQLPATNSELQVCRPLAQELSFRNRWAQHKT